MTDPGRPPFEPNDDQRRQVEQMVMCGMPQEQIATVVGCTKPTLRKHFKAELKAGSARQRASVLAGLFAAASKGNVAALKKLEEMGRLAQAAADGQQIEPDEGKKAARQAKADAVVASGGARGRLTPMPRPRFAIVGGSDCSACEPEDAA